MKIINVIATSLFATALAGDCPFGFDKKEKESAPTLEKRVLQTASFPSEVFTCPAAENTVLKT